MDPFVVLGIEPTHDPEIIRNAWKSKARVNHPDAGGTTAAMQQLNDALARAMKLLEATEPQILVRTRRGVARETASFTISVLPVEAFEALLIVASWIGDVLLDDPPYALEIYVRTTQPFWMHLDMVPEAGATMVSLTIGSIDDHPVPTLDSVRDELIEHLNRIDWNEISA